MRSSTCAGSNRIRSGTLYPGTAAEVESVISATLILYSCGAGEDILGTGTMLESVVITIYLQLQVNTWLRCGQLKITMDYIVLVDRCPFRSTLELINSCKTKHVMVSVSDKNGTR